MSNKVIILHDDKATDAHMVELLGLLERIVPKLDSAIGMDIGIDCITDMTILKGKDCEHVFDINSTCDEVKCFSCNRKFAITVNKRDIKRIEEKRTSEEKSVVDDVGRN